MFDVTLMYIPLISCLYISLLVHINIPLSYNVNAYSNYAAKESGEGLDCSIGSIPFKPTEHIVLIPFGSDWLINYSPW